MCYRSTCGADSVDNEWGPVQPVQSSGERSASPLSTCSSVPPENCNRRNRFGSLEAAGPVVGERLLDFRLRVHDERASKRDRLAQRLAGEKQKAAGSTPRRYGKFRRSRLLRSRQPAKLTGLQKAARGPDLDRAFEDVDKGIVGC